MTFSFRLETNPSVEFYGHASTLPGGSACNVLQFFQVRRNYPFTSNCVKNGKKTTAQMDNCDQKTTCYKSDIAAGFGFLTNRLVSEFQMGTMRAIDEKRRIEKSRKFWLERSCRPDVNRVAILFAIIAWVFKSERLSDSIKKREHSNDIHRFGDR